jgi:hypothetical protein
VDKITFLQNLVEASMIEQRFLFLDDDGRLAAPKRISEAGAAAAQGAMMTGAAVGLAAFGAFLGGGGIARVPLLSRGRQDIDAIAAELRKYRAIAEIVGIMLRTGQIVLQLGVDADNLDGGSLANLFPIIHQRALTLRKYADSFGGEVQSLTQVISLFSEHSRAKHFVDKFARNCLLGSAPSRAVTQPWIVDLQDEKLTTPAGFWHWRRQRPLDAKGMLPRLFQRRSS